MHVTWLLTHAVDRRNERSGPDQLRSTGKCQLRHFIEGLDSVSRALLVGIDERPQPQGVRGAGLVEVRKENGRLIAVDDADHFTEEKSSLGRAWLIVRQEDLSHLVEVKVRVDLDAVDE